MFSKREPTLFDFSFKYNTLLTNTKYFSIYELSKHTIFVMTIIR